MSFLPNRNLVLVVDDDAAMLNGVKRLLRQHDYETILFSSAKAFKNHTDFESAVCVILDINLNDGSGIELRHRLKADGISVPVIYMTGNEDPAVRNAAVGSGCIAFLTKPFSAQSLIESLKKASAGEHLVSQIDHNSSRPRDLTLSDPSKMLPEAINSAFGPRRRR